LVDCGDLIITEVVCFCIFYEIKPPPPWKNGETQITISLTFYTFSYIINEMILQKQQTLFYLQEDNFMKLRTIHKKLLIACTVFCLGAGILTGCGSDAASTDETAAEELKEYAAESVGTFYLPDGFTLETGSQEEPLPMTWAALTKDSVTITASRFGQDAYDAAGLELPADLEEYSQRAGVRQNLPEDAEFAEDSYGNFYVQYTQDGTFYYQALKKGKESYGGIIYSCPEGEESGDYALWLSKFVLD